LSSNVSSLSSIDDCRYYQVSLTAMFCPSIVATMIAFGLVFRAVQKQKKERNKADDTCCGSALGNAAVLAFIGLGYPIFLLWFSFYFGFRLFTDTSDDDEERKELKQMIRAVSIMKLIENLVEALPQLVVAVMWLRNQGELEACKEAANGEGAVLDCATGPVVSLVFSSCSLFFGIIKGSIALNKLCKSKTCQSIF